ncbi:SDR family oxidoreductase [Streptomyces sp. NBC_00963]|uniref:SDR family NAD(P)-dependent oxidoreductase n=1 Tax=Streptomyces sp. NBC_00963 TaxID=2903697 RepID=UPI00386A2EA9|nr:SDR family oxidoreductase [Streptomyces sp. NBC_00963]
MTEQDLAGRTALVTGSTSGIGEATAKQLAKHGAHVIVVGRRQELGDGVVAAIRAAGGKADYVRAELSGAASARELAKRALETSGGQIDILINNAGTAVFGPTAETLEENWEMMFNTNLKGHFFLVAELAPKMAARGKGVIVNTSTMVGQFAVPGMAVYGATKAALNLLTKSWAAEFGPAGVRVNAVSPGTTSTRKVVDAMGDGLDELGKQAPLGYVADASEIADAIVYLTTDKSSYITGTILNVDGGRTAI